MADPRKHDWPVVAGVCAPLGRDAQALGALLGSWGAQVKVVAPGADLGQLAAEDTVSLLLLTDEALESSAAPLADSLREQPLWSDLPLILLSAQAGRGGTGAQWRFLRQFANLTVLGRPCAPNVLRAAFDAACRARAWQYTVRDQMQLLTAAAALLEQRVLERTAQLYAEVETRKRMESALNESRRLEAVGRLTAGVAHDFNNLLQVIQGSAAVLPLLPPGSERYTQTIDAIGRATTRAARLTHQLLAFGRRQSLNAEALDVAQQLEAMRELLQQSLRERIPLTLEVAPDLWHAKADPTQLEVALLNLTVNARDAMPKGGSVTIGARNVELPAPGMPEAVQGLQGDFVWLTVADTGAGMSPEVARQAFDPFFTTKPVGSGTGLGLSQVYGFAQQSGGTAWVESSESGTTVSILLPRSASVASAAAPADTVSLDGALNGVRVLMVEDDRAVADATKPMLEQLGCGVLLAASADEALRLPLEDIDIVFSDVIMPGSLDGVDLARHLRDRHPELPVLLASGYVIAPERLQGLGVSVLPKPYSFEALRGALLRTLAQRVA
jgi:signal transduction histidine kinase